MAVGGVAVGRDTLGTLVKDLLAINELKRARGEIKWGNTRERGVEVRKAYVDYFMKKIESNHLHFHIRFSPTNEYDHAGHRREFDTVSKMFYQLLLHRPVRYYGKTCTIRIRPDDGECTRLLPNFTNALNFDGQLTYDANPDCVHSIVPQNSRHQPILHLLDVMVGALTAYRNGRHLLGTVGEPKQTLAQYAFDAFGKKDLKVNKVNRDEGNKISVWNVVPKKRSP